MLEFCDAEIIQVALLQINLEKVFDRVRHDVLFKILETVDFGDVILQRVRMAYKRFSFGLIVNNNLSDKISAFLIHGLRNLFFNNPLSDFCPVTFGVPQGSSLTLSYFLSSLTTSRTTYLPLFASSSMAT